jgi:trigger factor
MRRERRGRLGSVTRSHGIVAGVPAAVKTTLTELDGSRVRLRVEVPADEVEGRLERKAHELGRDLKLPGFRRGKVPPALVIQRIGRDAVLEQAVRETLPRWYSDAIAASGIVPVGDPEVELDAMPPHGEPLAFSVEVGVVPRAQLGEYRGLDVPRREPAVPAERVEAELEAVRDRLARLESVDRPAERGDFVIVDYEATFADDGGADATGDRPAAGDPIPGAEARDQLIELGAGNLIPGFEEGVIGATARERRELPLSFPADYPSEQLAGRSVTFIVTVKDVKRKELPPLDDDLALDAGFESLAELRDDIGNALLAAEERVIEGEFREAALDAAVQAARIELTDELVKARASEMWERMLHSLAHRGVSREAYLKLSGREEEQILSKLEQDAERALRREALISAIVEAEGISPSDEELISALAASAEEEGVSAEELLERLRARGRLEEVREDLAARQAVELIASEANAISPAKADARERLWTPERADAESEGAGGGRLWTPTGSGPAS